MAAPLIGITAHAQTVRGEQILLISPDYSEAVRVAGGIPVIIPILPEEGRAEILDRLQGIFVTAGGRLARHLIATQPLPSLSQINPGRYAFERSLILETARRNLPMLGVCRGMQTIAEVMGGRITGLQGGLSAKPIQHYQRQPGWQPTHAIVIQPGSRLERVLGERAIRVNSFHRQAVAEPGTDLHVSALAEDGVVEAIESSQHLFIVGVQFHPERLLARHERWLRLFRAFVEAAAQLA